MGTHTKFLTKHYSARGVLGSARYTFTGRDVAYVASLGSDWADATVTTEGVFFRRESSARCLCCRAECDFQTLAELRHAHDQN